MLDLELLQCKLDSALASETPESLNRWLFKQAVKRMLHSDVIYQYMDDSDTFNPSMDFRRSAVDNMNYIKEMISNTAPSVHNNTEQPFYDYSDSSEYGWAA